MRILVTGGCGFIGSHFIRLAFERLDGVEVVNLESMSYAANRSNLADIEAHEQWASRYSFIEGDIADPHVAARAVDGCTHIVNFAAETHVDRSIQAAHDFIRTDVLGPYVLLEAAREAGVLQRFVQVSTDEVYGSRREGSFVESDRLSPASPYSASKAGGELQVRAHMTTYGTPVIITRGSNTYGPNQYPEKLLPLFATNALEGEPLPLYGDGRQVRDWIHVRDHASGILAAMLEGTPGEAYNVGGGNERENLWITQQVLAVLDVDPSQVRHVEDRAGHDFRYSIDSSSLKALGWQPDVDVDRGIADTIRWYADNRSWWQPIRSGEFKEYYKAQYASRLAAH